MAIRQQPHKIRDPQPLPLLITLLQMRNQAAQLYFLSHQIVF